MPQPSTVDDIADDLIRAYAKAWENVVRAQDALGADPAKWREARRLRELQRAIQAEMDSLDEITSAWLSERFPEAYALGASQAGVGQFVWQQASQAAVQRLAGDLHKDLLKSTKRVRRTTKELVRSVAKDANLATVLEGQTALGAARVMARRLAEDGISAVTYADGSKHGLEEYANVAVRTKTAVAYNLGAIDQASSHGVKFFEVFDGPFCGWRAHDDPQLALGMIVGRDEALGNPVSHPNCRRSFGARPDVTNKKQAARLTKSGGGSSVTKEQIEAQKAADEARAVAQRRRAARRRVRRSEAPGPRLPQPSPQAPGRAARAARLENRLARTGQLDLSLPSPAVSDVVLPQTVDYYKDVKSVEQLIQEGWKPDDALKEHKRLKANAASRASKAKAKALKQGLGTSQKDAVTLKTAPPPIVQEDIDFANSPAGKVAGKNPKAIHPVPGGLGSVEKDGDWARTLKADTPEYIPVIQIEHQGRVITSGIATRRGGVRYLMETTPGEPVTKAVQDEFERRISIVQSVAYEAPGNVYSFAFVKGANPADAHWAEKYNLPAFKSAATGGNGKVTFWDTMPTYGTVRHEIAHTIDRKGLGGPFDAPGAVSESAEWAAAVKADTEHAGVFHFYDVELKAGNHPITPYEPAVTAYGRSSPAEDFAESYRLFMKDKYDGALAKTPEGVVVRFRDIWPERARLLEDALGLPHETAVTAWQSTQAAKAAEWAAAQAETPAVDFTSKMWGIPKSLAGKVLDDMEREAKAKAVAAMEAAAAEVERVSAQTAGYPGFTVAKKQLPANVKASVASAKSKTKSAALKAGKTAEEAQAAADAAEAAEVERRWSALFGSRSAGARANGAVGGRMSPQTADSERLTGVRFLNDPGLGGLKSASSPQGAKAAIANDLADRLNNEAAWNVFREAQDNHAARTIKKALAENPRPLNDEQARVFEAAWASLSESKLTFIQRAAQTVSTTSSQAGGTYISLERGIAHAVKKFGMPSGDLSDVPSFEALAAGDRQKRLAAEVRRLVQNWAGSSGDTSLDPVTMQLAIKEEFGLSGADPFAAAIHGGAVELRAEVAAHYADVGAFYRLFTRVMYEHTQAALKKAGITRVSLYRGMRFNGASKPDWVRVGQTSPKLQPANSWSVDYATAQSFGHGGYLIKASIPAERILGSARTGFGCLSESEYVVFDTDGQAAMHSASQWAP